VDVNLLAFVFGALLLFVAIIGGGFELRELKVPKVGWAPRVVALVAGLIFVGIGVANNLQTVPSAEAQPPVTSQPEQAKTDVSPIDFTITDQLGDAQVSERVAVEVDDRMVGTLTVDTVHPTASITVTVPKTGNYAYTLDSTAVFEADDGSYPELIGHGTGQVQVTANKSFALVGNILDDGTMQIALE
jgi:hypothetical protein